MPICSMVHASQFCLDSSCSSVAVRNPTLPPPGHHNPIVLFQGETAGEAWQIPAARWCFNCRTKLGLKLKKSCWLLAEKRERVLIGWPRKFNEIFFESKVSLMYPCFETLWMMVVNYFSLLGLWQWQKERQWNFMTASCFARVMIFNVSFFVKVAHPDFSLFSGEIWSRSFSGTYPAGWAIPGSQASSMET